jgi:hypothetical protein
MLVALLVATPVWADQAADEAKAKGHFDRGQTLYAEGRYREARAEFSSGYDLSGKAAFVFNMAECSRLVGDIALARVHYKTYLAKEADGKLAPLAKQRLRELGVDEPSGGPTRPVTPPPSTTAAKPVVTQKPATIPSPGEVAARREGTGSSIGGLEHREPKPLWKKWPFWAAVGGGVVATSAIIYVATRSDGGADIDWK